MAFSKLNFSSYFPVLAGAFLVFGVALTVVALQQQQDTRSKAAELTTSLAPGTACTNGPADIMLIIDKSGSMSNSGTSGTRLSNAKTAAKKFIDIVSKNTNNRVGLVTFSTTATLDSGFTTNYASVKSKIDAINVVSHTCTQCGVKKSNAEIVANSRANVKKVVVLLTDGRANWLEGWSSSHAEVNGATTENPVITLVNSIFSSHKAVFYTIGLGSSSDVNATFLNKIASSTGGHYYASPTTTQLNTIYTQISATVGTGSIGGFVFQDSNGNATFDTGETKLPDWTLQLFAGTSTSVLTTAISDSGGNYKFQGLCDGSYKVKQVLKPDWVQTVPTTAEGYTVSITNGSQITDRHFGNKPPAEKNNIKLSLDILMHGIGKAGDSPNPGPAGGGNPDPVRKNREVKVELINSQNQTTTKTGKVDYQAGPGNFTGIVDMGVLPAGNYLVKVKLSQSLKKQIGGIQNLPAGTTSALAQVSLVTGDINDDNKVSLDITDYNLLLGCFSTYAPAKSCDAAKKLQSDLDDNGKVDQFDFNLFVREISHISN